MKIETGKRDYLWSYFAYILKFGANLFVFPLVLRILSSEDYGIWITFSSLGVVVNLFDFGFSSTLLRNMTYVWGGAQDLQEEGYKPTSKSALRNDKLFVLTFRTCQKIYLVIAGISFAVSCSAGTMYILYIVRNIYNPQYIIAWFIYCLSISLNLYYAYWSVSLRSVGAIQESQKATVIGYIVQLVISYMGLLLGCGIVSLSLANCICGVTIRLISRLYLMNYQKIGTILKNNNNAITIEEYRDFFLIVWHNAKKAGVSSIATVIMTQCTTLICSAFLSVSITGEYGLCLQILNALSGVAQIYYQTTIPKLTHSRQLNDLTECQRQFSLSVTVAWFIYLFGFLFVVLLGDPLMSIIKSQTSLNIYMFIVMFIISFGEMNYSMHASYISLENKLPFVSSVVKTAGFVVLLSLFSAFVHPNIWTILGVRCIVECVYIFWKWPLVAQKQLNLKIRNIICLGVRQCVVMIK